MPGAVAGIVFGLVATCRAASYIGHLLYEVGAGDNGVTMLVIGGTPGKAFEPKP